MTAITKENVEKVFAITLAQRYMSGDISSLNVVKQLINWDITDKPEELLNTPIEEQYKELLDKGMLKKEAKMCIAIRLGHQWKTSKDDEEYVEWVEKNYPKYLKAAKKLSA